MTGTLILLTFLANIGTALGDATGREKLSRRMDGEGLTPYTSGGAMRFMDLPYDEQRRTLNRRLSDLEYEIEIDFDTGAVQIRLHVRGGLYEKETVGRGNWHGDRIRDRLGSISAHVFDWAEAELGADLVEHPPGLP
jgi:hypothetical protein